MLISFLKIIFLQFLYPTCLLCVCADVCNTQKYWPKTHLHLYQSALSRFNDVRLSVHVKLVIKIQVAILVSYSPRTKRVELVMICSLFHLTPVQITYQKRGLTIINPLNVARIFAHVSSI